MVANNLPPFPALIQLPYGIRRLYQRYKRAPPIIAGFPKSWTNIGFADTEAPLPYLDFE